MAELILVIDDDAALGHNVAELLIEEGFGVIQARSGADGIALAKARQPKLIVCDIMMPGVDGHEVLRALRESPATAAIPFIFLSARAERADIRAGMNLGADDYLTKPFELLELLEAVQSRLRRMDSLAARSADAAARAGALAEAKVPAGAGLGVVVTNAEMQRLYADLARVAASNIGVLLLGETGVGKEIVAHAVHELSPRKPGPFLPLNCAALSESLLEAELFGHEKGAFTGAIGARPGLFEAAHGGSVFLDEVGELPLSLQSKLLRVLEERKVLRVGGRVQRDVDVRFIAATNRDLERGVREHTFREDLFYRLNGVSFLVPPLRARRDEIAPLCRMFVARACAEQGRPEALELSPRALAALESYDWPGNVRELRNAIERGVVLCTGERLELEHLPPKLASVAPGRGEPRPGEVATGDAAAPGAPAPGGPAPGAESHADSRARLERELRELERRRILDALEKCGGSQTLAARHLGVSRRTLLYRLDALDLPRPRKRT